MTRLSELRNIKQFRKFLSLVESSSASQGLSLTAFFDPTSTEDSALYTIIERTAKIYPPNPRTIRSIGGGIH
eukprot:TRINITY_DN7487_c0_g1_i1.p1 TRINITY_DN7487_c0_g1~~TRINITY_DN7487_c0_g1_i1.p1  ORF type:complete len:72 (-),score=3.40 TRINITY_DN7487_c0_g1_i1:51-266(-)